MKTAALYIRCSKKDQNTDNQLLALQDYALRREFSEILVYTELALSGATRKRPRLDDLMRDAKLRRFDTVIVARFDRFARSVSHLSTTLEEFEALGIDFVSLGESIDTTTPLGKMVFHVAAAFAQFERNIIQERIHMGLDRARKEGKQLGRPKRIFDRDRVLILNRLGVSSRQIAKVVGVSQETVLRAIRGRRKIPTPLFGSGD